MGPIDEPGTLAQLAFLVEDHYHFTELLRACEPTLRREMYEAMRPHLRFQAMPLDLYDIAAKEHAAAAQLPVMDTNGNLQPYTIPAVEVPEVELYASCRKCGKEGLFYGDRKADAIQNMRHAGWAWNELDICGLSSLCPDCLEEVPYAVHETPGEVTALGTIPIDPGAEGKDESGTAREPETRTCQEGLPGHEA